MRRLKGNLLHIFVIFITLPMVFITSPLFAQIEADFQERDMGDRWEGQENVTPIHGRFISLVSCQLLTNTIVKENPSYLTIFFWLPDAHEDILVHVHEPFTKYNMKLKPRSFDKGLNQYQWPTALFFAPLAADIRELQVLVTDGYGIVHYPARVSTQIGHAPAHGYRFSFLQAGLLDVTASIYSTRDGKLDQLWSKLIEQDMPGLFHIEWYGKDRQSMVVPTGELYLKLTGSIILEEDEEAINLEVPFMHRDLNAYQK